MNKFAAVIYDSHNVITRVEERPTSERATRAGEFYTRANGWYKVISGEDDIELYKALINF